MATLDDINSTQQQGVKNLGLILQAIQTTFPGQFVGVPANSAAAGTAGQFSYNANFFFICVGAGEWRRVALSTF